MLELADRDFKAPIINIFKNERKSCLDKVWWQWQQKKAINRYKKESNENSRITYYPN